MALVDDMNKLYSLMPWPEDLEGVGRRRYEAAVNFFRGLVDHPFLAGGEVRLLDLMGGVGIGGIALARALREAGRYVELTVLDLREDALSVARGFSVRELGIEARTIVGDAFRVHELVDEVDMVLIHGVTMPHFDPWRSSLLFSAISSVLTQNGTLLIHHIDQVYWELYTHPQIDTYAYFKQGDVVLSLKASYDPATGYIERIIRSLITGEQARYHVYQWGMADMAALMWVFFEEIDIIRISEDGTVAMLLGHRPRGVLEPDDLEATFRREEFLTDIREALGWKDES